MKQFFIIIPVFALVVLLVVMAIKKTEPQRQAQVGEQVKVVYVPEKTIVKEIYHEPTPAPTPQPVTCPTPQPVTCPTPQPVIIPTLLPPPRPAYIIPSPRRPFHPPIASRQLTEEINRAYNYYRDVRPNYRR
jgi:hypothetical protein